MLVKILKAHSLEDAPWTWGSTGGWSNGMPEFFQNMPSGVMDNIYEDLDDSPVTWSITEVLFVYIVLRVKRNDSRISRVG